MTAQQGPTQLKVRPHMCDEAALVYTPDMHALTWSSVLCTPGSVTRPSLLHGLEPHTLTGVESESCIPVFGKPGRVAGPDLLHGLEQHVLGQQLVHDAVCQAAQACRALCLPACSILTQGS